MLLRSVLASGSMRINDGHVQLRTSKLPFGDMAHIGLSYDFDLEISPGPVLGF